MQNESQAQQLGAGKLKARPRRPILGSGEETLSMLMRDKPKRLHQMLYVFAGNRLRFPRCRQMPGPRGQFLHVFRMAQGNQSFRFRGFYAVAQHQIHDGAPAGRRKDASSPRGTRKRFRTI